MQTPDHRVGPLLSFPKTSLPTQPCSLWPASPQNSFLPLSHPQSLCIAGLFLQKMAWLTSHSFVWGLCCLSKQQRGPPWLKVMPQHHHPPHSLLSNHFLAGALRSLPTLEIVCVCPRSVHFCRNLVSCSPLYWQDVDVRSVGGNKRTTQQQLRTVQRVWALPIRLRLSGCVSSGKLFHFSGLWAPHLKSRLRGPTG